MDTAQSSNSGPATLRVAHEKPVWYATVPGFPSVTVFHDIHREYCPRGGRRDDVGRRIRMEFGGTLEDLVACGVATLEMFAMNKPTGTRIKRIDGDGDPFGLERSWRSGNPTTGEPCMPYRWYSLTRWKPLALMRRLPGACEAIAAATEYYRWRDARHRRRAEQAAAAAKPQPRAPKLRLIVHNTMIEGDGHD